MPKRFLLIQNKMKIWGKKKKKKNNWNNKTEDLNT